MDNYKINEEKINSVGDLALDWIVKRLDYFDIKHEVSKSFKWRLKTFVELVFLTNYLIRKSQGVPDDRLKKIIEFNKKIIQETEFEEMIYHDLEGIAGLAILQEFLMLENIESPSFIYILKRFEQYGHLKHFHRIPFRAMDLKYSLNRVGIEPPLPNFKKLYGETLAGKRASIPYMSTMDIYSVTHTIFYLTDMGNQSIDEVLALDEAEHLKELTLYLLSISIRQNDLDVTGELLMCCSFLGINVDSDATLLLYDSAWSFLYNNQMATGGVPSPTFEYNRKYEEGNESEEQYTFIHCYHTTLVTIGAVHSWKSLVYKEEYSYEH